MHFWVGETRGLPGTECVGTPAVHSTCSQGNAPVFTLQVSIANRIQHPLLPPPQQQFAVPWLVVLDAFKPTAVVIWRRSCSVWLVFWDNLSPVNFQWRVCVSVCLCGWVHVRSCVQQFLQISNILCTSVSLQSLLSQPCLYRNYFNCAQETGQRDAPSEYSDAEMPELNVKHFFPFKLKGPF